MPRTENTEHVYEYNLRSVIFETQICVRFYGGFVNEKQFLNKFRVYKRPFII